jgi:hypothetical protein
MTTIERHLQKHPGARPSTLRQIQATNAKTEQLRREVGMDAIVDRRSRFVAENEPKETVLQRLLRKFVRA